MSTENFDASKSTIRNHIGLISLLLLLLIGPLFGPVTTILGDRFDVETAVTVLLIAFLIGFTIILLILFRFQEMKAATFSEQLAKLGWGQPSRLAANIAAVIIGLAWGALFLTSILQFQPDTNLAQINGYRIAAALMAFVGTVMEDLITRGYIMNGLRKINVPSWGQLILSALLFAVYHTIWSFNLFSFIFSLVFGLLLSGLFLWGKRSLTPVIIAHGLSVLIAEPFSSMLIFIAPSA